MKTKPFVSSCWLNRNIFAYTGKFLSYIAAINKYRIGTNTVGDQISLNGKDAVFVLLETRMWIFFIPHQSNLTIQK